MMEALRRYNHPARHFHDGDDELDESHWDGNIMTIDGRSAVADHESIEASHPLEPHRSHNFANDNGTTNNNTRWDWSLISEQLSSRELSPQRTGLKSQRRKAVSYARNLVEGEDKLDLPRRAGIFVPSNPALDDHRNGSGSSSNMKDSSCGSSSSFQNDDRLSGKQLLHRQQALRHLELYNDGELNDDRGSCHSRHIGMTSNGRPYSDAAKTSAVMIVAETNDKMMRWNGNNHGNNESLRQNTARTDRTTRTENTDFTTLSSTRTDRSTMATPGHDDDPNRSSSVIRIYTKNHRVRGHSRSKKDRKKGSGSGSDDTLSRLEAASLATRRKLEVQDLKQKSSRAKRVSRLRDAEVGMLSNGFSQEFRNSSSSNQPTKSTGSFKKDNKKKKRKSFRHDNGAVTRNPSTTNTSLLSKFGRLLFPRRRTSAGDDSGSDHFEQDPLSKHKSKHGKRPALFVSSKDAQSQRHVGDKRHALVVSSSSMDVVAAANAASATEEDIMPSFNVNHNNWNRNSTRSITSHTSATTAMTLSPAKPSKRSALLFSGDDEQSRRNVHDKRHALILTKSHGVGIAAATLDADAEEDEDEAGTQLRTSLSGMDLAQQGRMSSVRQRKRQALFASSSDDQSRRRVGDKRGAMTVASGSSMNVMAAVDAATAAATTVASPIISERKKVKNTTRTKPKAKMKADTSRARAEMRILHAIARAEHNARVDMLSKLGKTESVTSTNERNVGGSRVTRLTMTGDVITYDNH